MKVPLSGAWISSKEKEYVLEVLDSGILSMGRFTRAFEDQMAQFTGRQHAIAVSSGTAGLFLVLKSLGIGSNDEIITTPFSFISSANVIIHADGVPVFADISDETLCIDPDEIEELIAENYTETSDGLKNKETGRMLKGILPVDIFGVMPDYERINKIAEDNGLFILEDSCEALGSEYKQFRAGSMGIASVLAFYPNKQITTGEGGIILTDDSTIARTCSALRNQGRSSMDLWLDHSLLGYNFRTDEMSAAVGVAQMERIEEILLKREEAAEYYNREFGKEHYITLPPMNQFGRTGWFVYVIQVDSNKRNTLMQYLIDRNIGVRPYFTPIHLQKHYSRTYGYKPGDYPVTESVADRTLAIPFHSLISRREQDYVINTIREFFNG